jgi:3-isopropylmalate/(R)-2-methylmalate dehydratase large subunit
VNGGIGYAYEYAGDVFDRMSMEERMTVCNMSIEGGARCGYVNPDETTFDYLEGRPYAPGRRLGRRRGALARLASDPGAPTTTSSSSTPPTSRRPSPGASTRARRSRSTRTSRTPTACRPEERAACSRRSPHEARGRRADPRHQGRRRLPRLVHERPALATSARSPVLRGRRVAPGVQAIAVPGSTLVKEAVRARGDRPVLIDAGFEWRAAGCSMCLAMNPDKLVGDQLCASSSNRNFKGRQGSATGRTVLMSPVMVAAAAVTGVVADAREVFGAAEAVSA